MKSETHIVENNLSLAWVRAMQLGPEIVPLVVTVTGFTDGKPNEDAAIRDALDASLRKSNLQSCETVAGTIFPSSMWNPALPRQELYRRYSHILNRIKHSTRKNNRGTYFGRLVTGGSDKKYDGNQLEFIIQTYLKGTHRTSMLQAATFDPKVDHIATPRLGFPCMQHVAFSCFKENNQKQLAVTAFYATQTLVERAYGNYLGICRLGAFVAHELDLPLTRMTCVAASARREHALSSMPRVNAIARQLP